MYPTENNVHNNPTNGHHPQRSQQQHHKDPVTVVGIPSVSIQNNRLEVGSSQSSSTRSYTPLKVLGDGSFGTVWLCDWHGTLPPNTPLSPMQCGRGARPEWAGKRLVAVKRMKKQWEGGWDECQKLKELESLRAIPFHPNIIPLYDFFLLPTSKELYFVFESMEGNLYHLIKARKGKALAGGLVSSIFRQIVSGLDHIHTWGYFHRDMKPENVLVTTIGLHDYVSVSPIAPPNGPPEKDVVAIIKLADFGLARETKSKPPYTEYVSTRWYRAPEVLLLSRDYSNPVDIWALGTIMAELVNLRPLFPGSGQVDQVARICEILGDPSEDYGLDSHGFPLGGGKWARGVKLARAVGFAFPKIHPKDFFSLFDRSVPSSLVQLIGQLLKYDPDKRLTARQCLEHPYLLETTPRNHIPLPSGLQLSIPSTKSPRTGPLSPTLASQSPRSLPPSHSHHSIQDGTSSHRAPFFASTGSIAPSPSISTPDFSNGRIYQQHPVASSTLVNEEQRNGSHSNWTAPDQPPQNGDYPMLISPQGEKQESFPTNGHFMEAVEQSHGDVHQQGSKPRFGFRRWFGGDKAQQNGLPPVEEVPPNPNGLKRANPPDIIAAPDSPVVDPPLPPGDLKKANKKEAQKVQREAEKQRRALMEKTQRDQARAVMMKRNQLLQKTTGNDLEWLSHGNEARIAFNDPLNKGKEPVSGRARQPSNSSGHIGASSTISAASGRFAQPSENGTKSNEWRRDDERATKVRRQEFDDGMSTMSSSDVHSIGRMSSISFATVDSDPGPNRIRNRPSIFGLNRMTSTSSLRTSFDDFPASARSSNSLSLEGQLANDFRVQASVDPVTPLSGSVSPPPIHMLSLSPTLSPQIPSSPPWIHVQHPQDFSNQRDHQYVSIPPPSLSHLNPSGRHSPYDYSGHSHSHPPSPGYDPKSAINPIFKVPPLPASPHGDGLEPAPTLPPFSHLEAVAEGEYPPLSPMAFHTPEDV
ncbi:Protein kinase domain-containing protein [Pleurotus pulmonarius]